MQKFIEWWITLGVWRYVTLHVGVLIHSTSAREFRLREETWTLLFVQKLLLLLECPSGPNLCFVVR